eukprot:c15173_g1_i3.p1 GENE.c15173_g1_i3~~c15173_g1_i3.p1  ORF type:complete len:189 (+),score=43.33 c15173_g1_i3:1-567(+)
MGATHAAMGNIFMRLTHRSRDYRILMVGLDAAGKTTVLFKLKLGEVITTIPTIGFNIETVQHKNISFTVWDVGGQDKLRPLWHHYFANTNGLIFLVDCNDRSRVDEAKSELDKILTSDELRDTCVLVLANKQDLPHAMPPDELAQRLGLTRGYGAGAGGRAWKVQGCCAANGDGLYEGLDWLASQIRK